MTSLDPTGFETGTEAGGNSVSSISNFRFTGGVRGAKSSSREEYQPPICFFYQTANYITMIKTRRANCEPAGVGLEQAHVTFN
jgi:hypothetical protein